MTDQLSQNPGADSHTQLDSKLGATNSIPVDEFAVNAWMRSLGFEWISLDDVGNQRSGNTGYWNIDHPNGTHESVTQLVAIRFYQVSEHKETDHER